MSTDFLVRKDTSILDNSLIFYQIGQNLENYKNKDTFETIKQQDTSGFGLPATIKDRFVSAIRFSFDADPSSDNKLLCQLILNGEFRTDKKSYISSYEVIYFTNEFNRRGKRKTTKFEKWSAKYKDHEAFYETKGLPIDLDQLHYAFYSKQASKRLISYMNKKSQHNEIPTHPKIKKFDSIDAIKSKRIIQTFKLRKPLKVGGETFDRAIVGTRKDDTIAGSSANEIIIGGKGNDVLIGKGGADAFFFDDFFDDLNAQSYPYTIAEFKPKEGDKILLDKDAFSSVGDNLISKKGRLLPNGFDRYASNYDKFRKLQESKYSFVYKPVCAFSIPGDCRSEGGFLYYNENGKEEGWGDGGVLAFINSLNASWTRFHNWIELI